MGSNTTPHVVIIEDDKRKKNNVWDSSYNFLNYYQVNEHVLQNKTENGWKLHLRKHINVYVFLNYIEPIL